MNIIYYYLQFVLDIRLRKIISKLYIPKKQIIISPFNNIKVNLYCSFKLLRQKSFYKYCI